jgi:hypothetical protein
MASAQIWRSLLKPCAKGARTARAPSRSSCAGRVDHHTPDQAEGIDQQMALAAKGLLAGVLAALGPAAVGRLDRLRVEDRGRGLALASLLPAQISLPAPAAGFGRRDQGFEILPLSVGKVARVELVAHTRMLPKPTETF